MIGGTRICHCCNDRKDFYDTHMTARLAWRCRGWANITTCVTEYTHAPLSNCCCQFKVTSKLMTSDKLWSRAGVWFVFMFYYFCLIFTQGSNIRRQVIPTLLFFHPQTLDFYTKITFQWSQIGCEEQTDSLRYCQLRVELTGLHLGRLGKTRSNKIGFVFTLTWACFGSTVLETAVVQ